MTITVCFSLQIVLLFSHISPFFDTIISTFPGKASSLLSSIELQRHPVTKYKKDEKIVSMVCLEQNCEECILFNCSSTLTLQYSSQFLVLTLKLMLQSCLCCPLLDPPFSTMSVYDFSLSLASPFKLTCLMPYSLGAWLLGKNKPINGLKLTDLTPK